MTMLCLQPRWLVACFLAVMTARVIAQEAQPATQPNTPTLPETRVEATPPLNPAYFDDGSPPLTGTILDGTLLTNQPIIGYRAPTSTSSTIIAVPDADLPGTVNTI